MIHNIHNLLNTIFNKHLLEIYKNNKIIRSEISEDKLIYYKFKYSQREVTKQNIVSNINFKFNTIHNASSYYRKEKNISFETYENIFKDIKNLHSKINNNNNNDSLLAIDGTYGNTNIKRKKGKIQTTLFMCYYDVSNNVPIDINFKMNNCNNEVKLAQKWLNEYKNINKEFIIVADRAYFKYDFFKFLIDNNIKFVIRIRNNAKNIKNLNCRYLEEKSFSLEKQVFNKKKNKYETIICNNKYSIITNIKEEIYTENKIFKIYEDRWNIEVFFKYLKKNFKLINLKEKKKEDNDKTITCQLIIIYISQLLKKYFIENNKVKLKTSINKKNNTITTCKIKINESLLIEGIFDNLLLEIIKGQLNKQLIENFINCYCKIIKNENNRSFERISLQPFTKWYIKKYLNDYKYCKILEALHNNDYKELNKNLKTKATTKVIK